MKSIKSDFIKRLSGIMLFSVLLVFVFQNCSPVSFETQESLELSSLETPPGQTGLCTPRAIEACTIENGTGNRVCSDDGKEWSTCTPVTCNPGYQKEGNLCLLAPCQNGAINPPQCNMCSNQNYWNGTSCQPRVCQPNSQRSCPIPNGTGQETCNNLGSAWGPCLPVSCNTNYRLINNQCVLQTCTNGAINYPTCNQCPANQQLINGVCATPTPPPPPTCAARTINWGQTLGCSGNLTSGNNNMTQTINSLSGATGEATFRCTTNGWTYESGRCLASCIGNNQGMSYAYHSGDCQSLITPFSRTHGQKLTLPLSTSLSSPGASGFVERTCYDGKLINEVSQCKPNNTFYSGPDCPAQTFYWQEGSINSTITSQCRGTAPATKRGTYVGIGNQNINTTTNTGFSGSLSMMCNPNGQWVPSGVVGCTQLKGLPQSCKGPVSFSVNGCQFNHSSTQSNASITPVLNSVSGRVGKILLNCNDGVWWQGPIAACSLQNEPRCNDLNATFSLRHLGSNQTRSFTFRNPVSYRIDPASTQSIVTGHYIVSSSNDNNCHIHLACNKVSSTQAQWDLTNVTFSGSCSRQ